MNILRADEESVLVAFKAHLVDNMVKSRGCTVEEAESFLDSYAACDRNSDMSNEAVRELRSLCIKEMARRLEAI